MAIPKTILKNFMQSTCVIKPDKFDASEHLEQASSNNISKSKLTFKRDNSVSVDSPNKIIDIVHNDPTIMLSESEKKIIIYLCAHKEKQDNLKLITKSINLLVASQKLNIPISTIKKSIQRLEKKAYIHRVFFKSGRDGWTIYSIPLYIAKLLS